MRVAEEPPRTEHRVPAGSRVTAWGPSPRVRVPGEELGEVHVWVAVWGRAQVLVWRSWDPPHLGGFCNQDPAGGWAAVRKPSGCQACQAALCICHGVAVKTFWDSSELSASIPVRGSGEWASQAWQEELLPGWQQQQQPELCLASRFRPRLPCQEGAGV